MSCDSASVADEIPLAEISEVRPTSNPLSAPALSLDRLRVQFGRGLVGAVFISPVDRDHFLDELAQKAGLKREGARLVRRVRCRVGLGPPRWLCCFQRGENR